MSESIMPESIKLMHTTAYDPKGNAENLAYAISAGAAITLLVVNILSLSGVTIVNLAWINLGLTTGGFMTAMIGGGRNKIGVIKESVVAIPLVVFSILSLTQVGIFGGDIHQAYHKLALATAITQGAGALYYLLGSCAITCGQKILVSKSADTLQTQESDIERRKKARRAGAGVNKSPQPKKQEERPLLNGAH